VATPSTGTTGSGAARPPGRRVTTVVVAGTHVRLARLSQLLSTCGVEVLGSARSVDDAVELVCDLAPDTVLLDLALGLGGLEVVERVMAHRPTPIVLTGPAAQQADLGLAAGAVDLVASSTEQLGPSAYSRALGRHLSVASRVRVITHPRERLREQGLAVDATSGTRRERSAARRTPVVVIGASTGGPPALAAVLGALPVELPAPVIVVQHMAVGFVEGLAGWLDGVVDLPVSVALSGDRLRPGHVVVAPSDGNLVVEQGLRLRIEDPRPSQLHVPEVDRTMRSVAEVCRDRAVGVLLTGMGRDGAAGLLALRRAGGFTIAQDEPTSAVWGMPAAAVGLDAVSAELPLPDIAAAVTEAVARLVVPEAV
jgi:two-component system chemotaxis response regulator CheB